MKHHSERFASVISLALFLWFVPCAASAQAAQPPLGERSAAGQPPVSGAAVDPAPTDPKGAAAAPAVASFPGERPLASLLGMTLDEAFKAFGPPEQVLPVRGTKAWEDDVAFYYPDHSYLFWYRDRVWEVRVDRRFTGTAIGVTMGESREQVTNVLGKPFHVGSDSEIFILPNRGYPVRARLFFTADRLSDLYVYRGDF